MKDTLGVLLAGGAGERLYPLTRDRAKPAVTFGGMYRIIDITLSNCLNSDLRCVYILTQYKALSLNRHIREGWNILGREVGEFIEVLPPMKRVSDQWYQGTADAVYQNIYSIGSEQPKHVLILSGDHIYKMDYGKMMKQHLDAAADITLATIQIDLDETVIAVVGCIVAGVLLLPVALSFYDALGRPVLPAVAAIASAAVITPVSRLRLRNREKSISG